MANSSGVSASTLHQTHDDVPMDEKKAPSVTVSLSQEPAGNGSTGRRTGWLTRLRDVVSTPARPDPFSEPDDADGVWAKIWKFLKFFGPGAIISVAYIDPDNYQTAISSGGDFQYKLLFMVLVSNLIAIYLQALAVKLGTVTGMDLAQMNHKHLPRWLELFIYAVAEACIVCTDLGQVIGTAIALNILIPQLPLWGACIVSVADTLFILLFYSPTGELRRIRIFEIFVALLVGVVFATICVALAMVSEPAGDVFKGFLPSRDIFVSTGLYESCAILGGTLMPHAIYVGSSLSRARLYDYDAKHRNQRGEETTPGASTDTLYRPSLRAVRWCKSYSIAELTITLFTVAIFVNSALVIISGSAFYDPGDSDNPADGDLYDLYNLFSSTISPVAGTIYAVSLLFSGVSAGIVATMAGQIVMEAALNIRISPFLRRLVTRCVAIIPALVVAVSVGQDGLAQALVACNYILAIALVFVTMPLVYYTCFDKYMSVPNDNGTGTVSFKNTVVNTIAAWVIWLLVVVMDIATIVLIALGLGGD